MVPSYIAKKKKKKEERLTIDKPVEDEAQGKGSGAQGKASSITQVQQQTHCLSLLFITGVDISNAHRFIKARDDAHYFD